jgi:hypothetical protein
VAPRVTDQLFYYYNVTMNDFGQPFVLLQYVTSTSIA